MSAFGQQDAFVPVLTTTSGERDCQVVQVAQSGGTLPCGVRFFSSGPPGAADGQFGRLGGWSGGQRASCREDAGYGCSQCRESGSIARR